jgi:Leucine Rich repeat
MTDVGRKPSALRSFFDEMYHDRSGCEDRHVVPGSRSRASRRFAYPHHFRGMLQVVTKSAQPTNKTERPEQVHAKRDTYLPTSIDGVKVCVKLNIAVRLLFSLDVWTGFWWLHLSSHPATTTHGCARFFNHNHIWMNDSDPDRWYNAVMNGGRHVTLRDMAIGDEDVRQVARALCRPDCQVQWLDLGGNNITAQGARVLAEALPSKTVLQKLYLGSNNVGNDGARFLADVLRLSNHGIVIVIIVIARIVPTPEQYRYGRSPIARRRAAVQYGFANVGPGRE